MFVRILTAKLVKIVRRWLYPECRYFIFWISIGNGV